MLAWMAAQNIHAQDILQACINLLPVTTISVRSACKLIVINIAYKNVPCSIPLFRQKSDRIVLAVYSVSFRRIYLGDYTYIPIQSEHHVCGQLRASMDGETLRGTLTLYILCISWQQFSSNCSHWTCYFNSYVDWWKIEMDIDALKEMKPGGAVLQRSSHLLHPPRFNPRRLYNYSSWNYYVNNQKSVGG